MFERPPTHERLNQRGPGRLTRYFVLFMALVYTGLGLYLLLGSGTLFNLPSTPRRILGALFVFYGILRFVRTYQNTFRQTHDE